VEFATYLEKWRQTHSSRDAKRQAAVAEAGNTTPESSSSSSASAATESETQQQVSEEGNVYGQSYGETQYYTEDYADYTNTNANSGYTGQTY
jgi:radical SAM superfamily enzyme